MIKYREILFLKSIKGVGKSAIYNKYWDLLKYSESVEELKKLLNEKNEKLSGEVIEEAFRASESIYSAVLSDPTISVITVFDEEYPKNLEVMGNKRPLVLYIKGETKALKQDSIAVVGTREPSEWSKKVEKRLVDKILELSDRVIVSGLALGCDKIAHETTVEKNKATIAVLPGGVNVITPPSHKELSEDIVKHGGCLISEYEPDTEPYKAYYVERDAIIAALSDITFVMECDIKSGTMHTVDAAKKFNRKVGAFYPDDMSKGKYAGNEHIINDMEGIKVANTEDLVRLLEAKDSKVQVTSENSQEQLSFLDLIENPQK